ncbi:ANTAR domain-containing protein [Rhodococcus sp. G-MC3]|uniref:ANTAR domain-containing protein n=1 Tax=Rhodococcus sp. G-MC3 TaxID=3046209 RepID=UPI0024BA1F0C|nr:ANTAR domain-containing protein [Rhodococcus sp. G-MC3]MDJ0395610.1 ANTAR domain-containing protein [Rhodococcus sp. G-MC3]
MNDSRTSIDWAVGVLIALRGYSPEQAFEELVAHSYNFDVSLLQSARSLVAVAREVAAESLPVTSTEREWGGLLADRRPVDDGIENVA